MTRKELLDAAAGCVLHDRASQYGGVEDNFGRIAELWTKYLGVQLAPHDVAAMMVLLKIARLRANPHHDDSWVDLAGYAACGAECAGAAKAREEAVHEAGEEYRRLREQEPEFNPGDAVEAQSFDKSRWEDAVVERTEILSGRRHYTVRLASGERRCLPAESVRRPSVAEEGSVRVETHWPGFVEKKKAEGCEELVQDEPQYQHAEYICRESEWGHVVFVPGERDEQVFRNEDVRPVLPKAKQELYQRIVDANPATYGHPHAPTGEELAEMAQEDGNG